MRNVIYQGMAVYELAKTIQDERLRQASHQRMLARLPRERSLSLGRYRITISKDAGRVAQTI